MEKYYLTTAIDYANAAPHIGHAYEKLAADIIARYQRKSGRDVFFLTGTDEHGSKIEETARLAGRETAEFVDEMVAKFEQAWKSLLISNDRFIRTTDASHQKVVQEVFRKMREKGDIYKGSYEGLYCEGCEDYLRERDLVDGMCANHKRAPKKMKEENYFFALTKYKDPLRKWLAQESVVRPDGRRREVLNQLEDEDFGDLSVSRPVTSLKWGIPVPDDPEHVIYVWIDALTNYITGVGYLDDQETFKKYWPADLHLIGKDIVKFHSIYWPAMLMACDIPLPKLVFGHGFITVEGQKMSKTLGNIIDPIALVDLYGADAIRYFLFAANSFDQDGDFSKADFMNIVNSHLANGLGNLLNRTLTQVQKNFGDKVPNGTVNADCLKLAQEAEVRYHASMQNFEFAKAIEAARSIVDEANKYLNDKQPWSLLKQGKQENNEEKIAQAGEVLLTSLELLKRAAVLLAPVIPTLANKIWDQLGFDGDITDVQFTDPAVVNIIPTGQALRNKGPIFQRLEDPVDPAVPA